MGLLGLGLGLGLGKELCHRALFATDVAVILIKHIDINAIIHPKMLLQQVHPILFNLFINIPTNIFNFQQLKLPKNTFRHYNLQTIKLNILHGEFFANVKRSRDDISDCQVVDLKVCQALT